MMKLVVLLVILPLCESIWPHPKETLILNGSPASFTEKALSSTSLKSKRLSDAFERFRTEIESTENTDLTIESIEFDIVDPVSEDLDMSTNVSYAMFKIGSIGPLITQPRHKTCGDLIGAPIHIRIPRKWWKHCTIKM